MEYHLILAKDLSAITHTDFESLSAQTIEVRRMLYGLRRKLDQLSADARRKTVKE